MDRTTYHVNKTFLPFQLTDVQHLILNSMVLKDFPMEWLLTVKENYGLLLLEPVR